MPGVAPEHCFFEFFLCDTILTLQGCLMAKRNDAAHIEQIIDIHLVIEIFQGRCIPRSVLSSSRCREGAVKPT